MAQNKIDRSLIPAQPDTFALIKSGLAGDAEYSIQRVQMFECYRINDQWANLICAPVVDGTYGHLCALDDCPGSAAVYIGSGADCVDMLLKLGGGDNGNQN